MPLPNKRFWLGSAGVALVLTFVAVIGLSRLKPERPPPAAPSPARAVPPNRIVAAGTEPLRLEGAPHPVASLLAVPGRMRYGQSVWDEQGVPPGPVWIRVDREAQLISVFRGGHEIGTAVILYGAPEKPTPAGVYPILAKHRHHRSTTYDADMPYTLRLTPDGVAIHASNVREGRATHGCIGVPDDFAAKLFEQAKRGDPVLIV